MSYRIAIDGTGRYVIQILSERWLLHEKGPQWIDTELYDGMVKRYRTRRGAERGLRRLIRRREGEAARWALLEQRIPMEDRR